MVKGRQDALHHSIHGVILDPANDGDEFMVGIDINKIRPVPDVDECS